MKQRSSLRAKAEGAQVKLSKIQKEITSTLVIITGDRYAELQLPAVLFNGFSMTMAHL
jgi:hypothetical protein